MKYSVLAILSVVIAASTLADQTHWNLNDVSFLYPLPKTKTRNDSAMLEATSNGSQGILLPKSVFSQIGALSNSGDDSSHTYENLRVVAARFDPCPTDPSFPAGKCEPEVRLVWQPVVWSGTAQTWTTEDAAVHTFYKLSDNEYADLKLSLAKLKTTSETVGISTENVPLGIHPGMLSSKNRAAFQNALNTSLLKNLGEKNLFKFTFMRLMVPSNWWKFLSGAIKKLNSDWEKTTIPLQGSIDEDIINDASQVDANGLSIGMDANIFALNAYPKNSDLRYIVSTGFRRTMTASEPDPLDFNQFSERIGAIHHLQNPHFTNPHTVDCAHCHYADAALNFAIRAFPTLKEAYLNHSDRFVNPEPERFNLTNGTVAPQSTKIVRAFGYFETSPAINQRVINDSAVSAHYLNFKKAR